MDEEKEKALASLRELSKLYTTPSSDPSDPPLHAYKLCGVSTKTGITYLRRRAESDLINMELDANEPDWGQDQWWKIHYFSVDAKPVSVMVCTFLLSMTDPSESSSHGQG